MADASKPTLQRQRERVAVLRETGLCADLAEHVGEFLALPGEETPDDVLQDARAVLERPGDDRALEDAQRAFIRYERWKHEPARVWYEGVRFFLICIGVLETRMARALGFTTIPWRP